MATLIERYTYGNFADIPATGPEPDFYLGIPSRQREMIALAKMQVLAQQHAARAIVAGQAESAQVIRREFERQTETLQAAIERGSEAVVSAIDSLGDRIAGELTEIRWELAQLRSIAEQVLEVLRRPRSTEAQELLQQGARHLVVDRLEQAEELFRRAYSLDSTDYQVLMNLSVVELRKGNAESAVKYTHEALTLPPNLDRQARANALWHLGRIHYAKREYLKALEAGKQSVAILASWRRCLEVGIYALLGGRSAEGLELILKAVENEPELFALAASAPDLRSCGEVRAALEELAGRVLVEFRRRHGALRSGVQGLHGSGFEQSVIVQFEERARWLPTSDRVLSYAECRDGLVRVERLMGAFVYCRHLAEAEIKLSAFRKSEADAASELHAVEQRIRSRIHPGCGAVVVGFGASFVVFVLAALSSGSSGQVSDAVALLTGALPFLVGIPVYILLNMSAKRDEKDEGAAKTRLGLATDAQASAERERNQVHKKLTNYLGA